MASYTFDQMKRMVRGRRNQKLGEFDMANKFDGDVRPLSNDQRYMGVVFTGKMANAIRQAKAAPDHGLAPQFVPAGMTRNRAALLEHLNLLPPPPKQLGIYDPGFYGLAHARARGWIDYSHDGGDEHDKG